MDQNQQPFVTTIIGHGQQQLDEIIIMPQNKTLYLITQSGSPLGVKEIFENAECYLSYHDRKKMVSLESYQIFFSNIILPGESSFNNSIHFRTTWHERENRPIFMDCGLITTQKLMKTLEEFPKNIPENKLCGLLMSKHDESICEIGDIWNKTIKLGELIKMIQSESIIGMFCRGNTPNYKLNFPEFVEPEMRSIKIWEKIFTENFFSKLEIFESCIKNRNFEQFELLPKRDSKLQKRVSITELTLIIRKKLAFNNTISLLEYCSTYQIVTTKCIPIESTMFSLNLKFDDLLMQLSDIRPEKIQFNVNIEKINPKFFKMGMIYLCKKMHKSLQSHINTKIIDNIIFTAELLTEYKEITIATHKTMLGYFSYYKFTFEQSEGFSFVFK